MGTEIPRRNACKSLLFSQITAKLLSRLITPNGPKFCDFVSNVLNKNANGKKERERVVGREWMGWRQWMWSAKSALLIRQSRDFSFRAIFFAT